jgi:hypothetical protein
LYNTNISFFSDFFLVLFSPKKFFTLRYSSLSAKRISVLGFLGVFFGLLMGNIISYFLTHYIIADLAKSPNTYEKAALALNVTINGFHDMIAAQQAYSMLLIALSPIIAFMASHIFGGSLYVLLLVIPRSKNEQINLSQVLLCAQASLASMAWYIIPALGPMLALISVGLNVSKALYAQYKLVGFMKNSCIAFAIYVSFILSSATLQIIAVPIVKSLQL